MLTIEYAKNPIYTDSTNEAIKLDVKFAEFANELPFTAHPEDSEEHGRILYANALNGDYGTIAPFNG